jgi:acyl transferase domain-containing protein/acyl carrier protein
MNKRDVEFTRTGLEIAVTGMSGRFPGAPDLDLFWENLKQGLEPVVFSTPNEWERLGLGPELVDNPQFVKALGAVLEDSDCFDAAFFDYVPSEAEAMDPQVRLFHECAWEAMENAGVVPDAVQGAVGVYAGASMAFKFQFAVAFSPLLDQLGTFSAAALSNRDFMCSRVSYKLGLKGPSLTMNTACSTSLVAIDLACRGILTGQCTMALAGGVGLGQVEEFGYMYQEGMIDSSDGHCRTFDARAKGTIGGEGVGVVLLKLLDDALQDGDTIHAVIKGSAVNNDGLRKVGYTAPSVSGQAEVIRLAHHMAEIESETIGYVETHGTATPLGDPVEVEALTQGFNTDKKGFCPIGSVKSNIGHLDSAAGIVGFLKTVLILKHRLIPPSLNYDTPNPAIDFENSPFFVNHTLRQWERGEHPLRAGVSSFGIGGTNAHVVLEEAPPVPGEEEERSSREYQLLLLSARTGAALEKMAGNMVSFFRAHPDISLADAAYTLQTGRKAFEYRRMAVCTSLAEAMEQLAAPPSAAVEPLERNGEAAPVVFLFPGLGAQYVNMGRDLYQAEPLFRQEMDRCFAILDNIADFRLKDILYQDGRETGQAVHRTDIAQAMLFVMEYALARLLMAWGAVPKAVMGYSFGEYTAACVAGVLTLEDALHLIVARGRLMRDVPAGAMLSVPLPVEDVTPLLPGDGSLSLAIDNGPSCIVAGSEEAVGGFEKEMKEKRLMAMRLPNAHAMHSHMVEPVLEELGKVAGRFTLSEPKIPCISNAGGTWMSGKEALDPGYWARHLRQTVRFAEGVKELVKDRKAVFVEVGPGRDLSALMVRHLENDNQRMINMVRPEGKQVSDAWYLLNKLGWLWLSGVNIDWPGFYRWEKRQRIPLPTYPFEGQRFRVLAEPDRLAKMMGLGELTQPGAAAGQDHRYYVPTWRREPLITPAAVETQAEHNPNWLVFLDDTGLGSELADRLEQMGHKVTPVRAGREFSGAPAQGFKLNPREPEDYRRLFEALADSDHAPDRVLHLWSLTGEQAHAETFDDMQYYGFYSLLNIVKQPGPVRRLEVVTDHLQDVTGEEEIQPEKGTMCGLLKVIPQEYPHLRCRLLDVAAVGARRDQVIEQLLEEIVPAGQVTEPVVAFRGCHRWVQDFQPMAAGEEQEDALPLKEGGVYLITGGLGEIGLALAEYLVKTFDARLILTGRSPVPPHNRWRERLDGAEVMAVSCDAADVEAMGKVIAEAEQRLGPINGVIHAAGIVGDRALRPLRETGETHARDQFRAKIHGTLVLADLFKDKDIDFIWLMSSLSTVLGGSGFGVYASANAFMDVFADFMRRIRTRTLEQRWLSVAWEGMPPTETVEGFRRVLSAHRVHRAAVSFGKNLHDRIRRWVKLEGLEETAPDGPGVKSSGKPRPLLMSAYEAPEDDRQRVLAESWQSVFGYDQVGVDDDFFELGGDSLKATVMLNKLHQELGVLLPLDRVFKIPTIRLLSLEFEKASAEPGSFAHIEPAEAREYYPVSSLQRRIYVLNEMEGDKTPYNMPAFLRVKGKLDVGRFEEAFRQLTLRHESLRTSFHMTGNGVAQHVHTGLEFELIHLPAGEEHHIISSFVRPFDLGQAPLLRVAVSKMSEEEYLLLLDMHHIISDGTSMGILISEFMTLYGGGGLEPPRLQYKDFAHWQQSAGGKELMKQQEQYWLNRFNGGAPTLNLFTDFPRPAVQSFEGGFTGFLVEGELYRRIRELVKETGATLYMVLLAVFNVLLFRYTGQQDIVVGVPVAGRDHADFQSIIGMFINTLPLRSFPGPQKSFEGFLAEVKADTLAAFENQGYSFGDLVEQLGLDGDISRNPLYDVELVLQNTEYRPLRIEGLEFDMVGHDTQSAQVDISINVEEIGENLRFGVSYCSRLYKRETIERLVEFYRRILETVTAHPGVRLAEIDAAHTMETADSTSYAAEDSEFEF